MAKVAQPRNVRVAAVHAIATICSELVRQKADPSRPVLHALEFLEAVAADIPTGTCAALDDHLTRRGFGARDEGMEGEGRPLLREPGNGKEYGRGF